MLTCDSVASLQPVGSHSSCHVTDHLPQLAEAEVPDYARLASRSACDCIVVAVQEVLGVVKLGTRKPNGYFLKCAFVQDLGFMLEECKRGMVAANTLTGGLEYTMPRYSQTSSQNV